MSHRVLLVDDEFIILDVLQAYLTKCGYDVHCARDKEEVAALVSKFEYSAVVADLGLSEFQLDGLQVIEQLSRLPSKPRVLVYSGQFDCRVVEKARQRGAEAFLSKPLKPSEIESKIRSLLAMPTKNEPSRFTSDSELTKRILEPGGMRTYLQPIVQADCDVFKVVRYECLTRGPSGTQFESPDILFQYCRNKGIENLADCRAIEVALDTVGSMPQQSRFEFNVHPRTLGHDQYFSEWFVSKVKEHCRLPERCTIEIIEEPFPLSYLKSIQKSVELLRSVGVEIALDDFGTGNSNLRMLLLLKPEVVKLDKSLVMNCHRERLAVAAIESEVEYARHAGANIIAEGIENEADLQCLMEIGIKYFQGYYFGRPGPADNFKNMNVCSNEGSFLACKTGFQTDASA